MRVQMESRYLHWKIGRSDNIGFPEIMVLGLDLPYELRNFRAHGKNAKDNIVAIPDDIQEKSLLLSTIGMVWEVYLEAFSGPWCGACCIPPLAS